MFQQVKKFEIFDTMLPANFIFGILGDINNKITNVTENCINFLNFYPQIANMDLFIGQIFLDLPEEVGNGTVSEENNV